MRIDWTQTLIGSPFGPDVSAVPGVIAARMGAVMAACLAMGAAIALAPLRDATIPAELLGLAGLLLGFSAGLIAASRFGFRGAALFGVLALPFLAVAGSSAVVMLGVLALVGFDLIAGRGLPRRQALAVGFASAAILPLGGFASGFAIGPILVLLTAWVPVVLQCRTAFVQEAEMPVSSPIDDAARLGAIVSALADGTRRLPLVTDIVGNIDPRNGFDAHLAGELFPEGSLMEAVLIADRVSLLTALSAAIHKSEASGPLVLRLRRGPTGAGYPMPPRFSPVTASVHPVSAGEGRAIVILDLSDEANVALPPEKSLVERPDAQSQAGGHDLPRHLPNEMIDRAIHDCAAPFNAGLGFLEMIADPRLAPRDIATYREFAAEAHEAITEAHRNTVLLAHWLRLETSGGPGEQRETTPVRLVHDAIRNLNLRDASEQGLVNVTVADDLPSLRVMDIRAARFAVEVLVRFGHLGPQCDLGVMRSGDDLVLDARRRGVAEPGVEDALQRVLEIAAHRPGSLEIEAPGEDHRRLLLAGVFAGANRNGAKSPAAESSGNGGAAEDADRLKLVS